MDKIMIFGAGQGGRMISNWISSDYHLLGFIDNNSLNPTYVGLYKSVSILTKQKLGSASSILSGKYPLKNKALSLYGNLLFTKSILVSEKSLDGQVAELGVYKGKFAAEMNRLFPNKEIYLFDTFEGFCKEDVEIEEACGYSRAKEGDFSDTSIDLVKISFKK